MAERGSRTLRVACVVLVALSAAGCVRGCRSSRPPIHPNPNMDYQPRYDPQEASDFFYDGASMRAPVAGTVARGERIEDSLFDTGKQDDGAFLAALPARASRAFGGDDGLLTRGGQRYGIYCAPCHDPKGNGKGLLYERGGVPTASFHDPKYLEYPDGQIYDVITNGFGLMSGYRYPIPAQDRWAIVAHVRKLQRDKQARDAALGAGQ